MSWEQRLRVIVEQALMMDRPLEEISREIADHAFRLGLEARLEQAQRALTSERFDDPRYPRYR